MAYNTKPIVTDVDGNPVSQYYNKELDQYEPVEGQVGANKVILYNADGTENDGLSLGPILDKLSQLTGTVIDEEVRKSNELQRIQLYNQIFQMLQDGDLKGDKGDIGLGLEFDWQGTSLGVKVQGDAEYIYMDLRGPRGEKGETGSIDNLDSQHIEDALGYVPVSPDDVENHNTNELSHPHLIQQLNEIVDVELPKKAGIDVLEERGLYYLSKMITGDFDDIPKINGRYMINSNLNSPFGILGWWYVDVYVHNPQYVTQVARMFSTGNGQLYERQMISGVWAHWDTYATTEKIEILNSDLRNGWVIGNNSYESSICKVGGVVNISLLLRNDVPNNEIITYLPHKPAKGQVLKAIVSNQGVYTVVPMDLKSDGAINLLNVPTTPHDWVSIVGAYNL